MSTEIVYYQFPDDGLPIDVMMVDTPEFSYPIHTHPFIELVLILSGQGTHVLGDTPVPVQAGDVFVVVPGNVHAYLNMARFRYINVLFQQEALSEELPDLRRIPGYHALFELEPHLRLQNGGRSRLHLNAEDIPYVIARAEQIRTERRSTEPGYKLVVKSALVQLVVFLSRRYEQMEHHSAKMLVNLGEVISYMERNYSSAISLPELARVGCMSQRNLIRQFRTATGHSPVDYMIRLRIRHALELLRDENLSVSQVSARVGIGDSNYFTRQFARVMGMTPRRYRSSLKE